MTPAEAAAYRRGLDDAAQIVEDRVPHATGGEIYIIADTAAAIRALPVPESAEATRLSKLADLIEKFMVDTTDKFDVIRTDAKDDVISLIRDNQDAILAALRAAREQL